MQDDMIQLTGKTFDARKQLASFGGTYSGASKTWSMTAKNWGDFCEAYPIMSRNIRPVGTAAPVMATASPARPARTAFAGTCPRCHSYCMGDCSAY